MNDFAVTAAIAFNHLSITKMTKEEQCECNIINCVLEDILINIRGDEWIDKSFEYIAGYIIHELQEAINIFNSKRSKKYRLWIDSMEIIDVEEDMDISEYIPPYQNILDCIISSEYEIPENLKLIIFDICVFVKGVPVAIVRRI